MEKPIFDPSIPYIGPIYGNKFTPGKMVRIQGMTPGTAYRFNIHLQCGPEIAPRDDVAIQISARLLEGYIIINSLQHGIWDEEQRGAVMPIKRAEKFEIIVMCDISQYKVAINGQHFCEFPQRIHYNRITHLTIDGDVSIMRISYESAAGDGVSSISGNRAPGLSVVPSTSNEKESDFEMINMPATSTSVVNSLPPSYGAASHDNQKQFEGQPHNTAAPYTVPYPTTGAAYPTSGVAYPTSGVVYPTTGAPYRQSGTAYPPPPGTFYQTGAPGMPPPPPGPPVPLNFSRPVQRSGCQKTCGVCGGIVFAILIIILITLKIMRTY